MSECIRGSYDDAVYKPMYTLLYLEIDALIANTLVHFVSNFVRNFKPIHTAISTEL